MFPLLGGIRGVGLENVPKEGPLLVAPVHFSNLDPPIVACTINRELSFMAKEELFKPPVFGPLIRSLNAFPIRRGDGDAGAIRQAVRALEEGRALIVFPEGTRGDGEHLGDIQAGLIMLAKRSNAQILPVGICGTHKVLGKGRVFPKPHRMRVAFGRPFSYSDVESDNPKETRRRFAEEMQIRLLEATRTAGLELKTGAEESGQS